MRQSVSWGTRDKLGESCALKGILGTEFPLTPSNGAALKTDLTLRSGVEVGEGARIRAQRGIAAH